ncbi:MAG: nitroreductase [Actinobacteria bacterium]|nr:nitroreductase [Actinomycetota bacterium]
MMTNTAETQYPILDVLASRRSPRAYDGDATLTMDDLGPAFEAARWAPSANNLQPWSFIVGYRGDDVHAKISETLSGFNADWAPAAGALVVGITNTLTASGRQNAYARYDLGQAVAHFSVQAQANGLSVHQMGGFDIDALTVALGVNEPQEVVVVFSVGKAGDVAALPEPLKEREEAPRERKPLTEVVR